MTHQADGYEHERGNQAETQLAPAAASRDVLTSTRRAKQAADLKHVVDNALDIEPLDYLTSISISLIGDFLDASASELKEATRPSPTAGDPNIKISHWEVTRIIAFQQYIRYRNRQPNPSLRIQDNGTINEDYSTTSYFRL